MLIRDFTIRVLVFILVLVALFIVGFAGGLALTPLLPFSIYRKDFDVVIQVVSPELILSLSLCFWAAAACVVWYADSSRLRRKQVSTRTCLLFILFAVPYVAWLMWMCGY